MIPTHLQGKSAEQVIESLKDKSYNEITTVYVYHIEGLLILAVKDALMNADATGKLHTQRAYDAEDRAVAFLNLVLPKE